VTPDLARRCAAEGLGTGFLVAGVIGSGIAAARLSPGDAGLQLLENSIATGAVLVALILALQPVSAAFNPIVTLVERVWGLINGRETTWLVASQVAGAAAGAVTANLMFGLDAVSWSQTHRASGGHVLGEVVATLGLVLVVFGGLRTGRPETVAWSVGGYIAAAYWFTSSTSFANPAVALARTLSDTFAGISPGSVPAFVLAELAGGAIGAILVGWLFRDPDHPARSHAQELTDV
jgi:glycerol uptake facilitator-like aquaporin